MSAHGVFYKKIKSKTTRFYISIFLLVCFASLNILYSQSFPAFMWDVLENKTDAVVSYLEHIQGTTQYQLEIHKLQEDNNEIILNALKNADTVKDGQIERLNEAIKIHSSNPELYYNLSVLYAEKGLKTQSALFLQKAQDLDVNIK